ncbi:MAG TPA: hypothetical protein VMU04_23570 [Candidatus Acidoferrum sp.]|nr:hypothetical protein [Candidatus Acidoferrum sp.]
MIHLSLCYRLRSQAAACIGLSVLCAAAAEPETDSGWPRTTTSGGSQIQVFQPQLENWRTNCLRARSVVQVTLQDGAPPHLGVVWFTANTRVDKTNRLVRLDDFAITRVQFSAAAEQEANLKAVLRAALPQGARTIALDRLVLASVAAQDQARRGAISLKHDPPTVIWTTNAIAALVLIDGDPALRPVQGSSLLRVINTASLIVFDPTGGTYYLAGDGRWFQAGGIAGPWAVSANPPAAVTALTPPADASKPAGTNADSPVVFVSTKPAELLHTTGEPSYQTESSSGLMYAANTDSQLLYDPKGSAAYLLLSGRWFVSRPGLTGPWSYVPPKQLPAAFAQISRAGPKANVLSAVPGTSQAAAARAANSLPQTATIQRTGTSFKVQYDGAPQLKPVESTDLQYAINASEPVILCQHQFYAVGNAVWFVADSPTGPWAVATSVPQDIYTIPPSSPLYYVTYVYVGYAGEDTVEEAYLPGYAGSYDGEDGTGPVYGTGWSYTPWVGDYYYGWGWPYGYDYQYRWWDQSWLWRPEWSNVGNLYAMNARNVYETWPRASAYANAYEARFTADRATGYGYPTTYGRFAGATRPIAMPVPARASLVDPYAARPATSEAAAEGRAEQLRSTQVGSAASRDLYATRGGDIYLRQDGNWYRADANGRWAYACEAAGPKTAAYHPETVANYDRATAYRPAAAPAEYHPPEAARGLDQDYYARAAGERAWQQSRSAYRGRR